MPRAAKGEVAEKAPMSAEALSWWPPIVPLELGGRRVELEASGVLLRLPMMLLADILSGVLLLVSHVVSISEGYVGASEQFQLISS